MRFRPGRFPMCLRCKFACMICCLLFFLVVTLVLAFFLWRVDFRPLGEHSFAVVVSHKDNKTPGEHFNAAKQQLDGFVYRGKENVLMSGINFLSNRLESLQEHQPETEDQHTTETVVAQPVIRGTRTKQKQPTSKDAEEQQPIIEQNTKDTAEQPITEKNTKDTAEQPITERDTKETDQSEVIQTKPRGISNQRIQEWRDALHEGEQANKPEGGQANKPEGGQANKPEGKAKRRVRNT